MQSTNAVVRLESRETTPKWLAIKFRLLGGSSILGLFKKKIKSHFVLFQPLRNISWACPTPLPALQPTPNSEEEHLRLLYGAPSPHTGRNSWRTYPTAEHFQKKHHYNPTQKVPVGGEVPTWALQTCLLFAAPLTANVVSKTFKQQPRKNSSTKSLPTGCHLCEYCSLLLFVPLTSTSKATEDAPSS